MSEITAINRNKLQARTDKGEIIEFEWCFNSDGQQCSVDDAIYIVTVEDSKNRRHIILTADFPSATDQMANEIKMIDQGIMVDFLRASGLDDDVLAEYEKNQHEIRDKLANALDDEKTANGYGYKNTQH